MLNPKLEKTARLVEAFARAVQNDLRTKPLNEAALARPDLQIKGQRTVELEQEMMRVAHDAYVQGFLTGKAPADAEEKLVYLTTELVDLVAFIAISSGNRTEAEMAALVPAADKSVETAMDFTELQATTLAKLFSPQP